jgi:pimeloyl-ACP methyl ester carboxylesterase
MPCFQHAGMSFYYEERGSGPPFVFSHGLGGDHLRALELVEGLTGLRVIVYDNRGHGRTRPLPHRPRLNFAAMGDDVAALLDRLSLEHSVVGGVSMGAGVALAFASRHPGRARALILSRPAWLDRPNPPNLDFAPVIADLLERYPPAEARDRLQQTAYYRDLYRQSPDSAKSLADALPSCDPEALVTAYRAITASVPVASLDDVKQIATPCLVIGTRDDPVHPFEYAQELAAALPDARLREIPSRYVDLPGHLRGFRDAVAEFLESA